MNCFANAHATGEHSDGNFSCTCSCAKFFLTAKHRLGISTYPLLRRLLIKVASHHVKQKVDVFQKGAVQKVLQEMDDDNPQELVDKMAICFLFLVFNAHQAY